MKSAVFAISLLASFLSFVPVRASLSGSARITPQDYIGLPPAALDNNPPACGYSYRTLDLSRITAVQALDKTTDCNKCIKVVNTKNNKFIYALAVDLGGSGLDLSIPSFKELFGQQYDPSPASWSETDYSHCAGIYSGGENPNSGSSTSAGSKIATTKTKSPGHARPTTTKVKKSSSHARPTPTKVKKSSSHARPTTIKVKKSSSHARPTPTKVKKSSNHARPTSTKTKSKTKCTKTKSPSRSRPTNKHRHHPKKQSAAGRRKQQQKHQ